MSDSPQRDSMIVAWHEVPGRAPPQKIRPVGYGMIRADVRTDSKIGGRKFRCGIGCTRSYRTLRDGSLEEHFHRHFVPGYDQLSLRDKSHSPIERHPIKLPLILMG